jgi:hypothetical protein
VLVSPHDGCVEHHELIVGIERQYLENARKQATFTPSAVSLVGRFPAPRDAGSIPVEHRVDEQAVVRRRTADMAFTARQHVLDPLPLIVAEGIPLNASSGSWVFDQLW